MCPLRPGYSPLIGRWGKQIVSRIHGRAAPAQSVRRGWSAIILQQVEPWIGVDPVAAAAEKSASLIAAQVVAQRGDGAIRIMNRAARCARFEDRVSQVQCRADANVIEVVTRVNLVAPSRTVAE